MLSSVHHGKERNAGTLKLAQDAPKTKFSARRGFICPRKTKGRNERQRWEMGKGKWRGEKRSKGVGEGCVVRRSKELPLRERRQMPSTGQRRFTEVNVRMRYLILIGHAESVTQRGLLIAGLQYFDTEPW